MTQRQELDSVPGMRTLYGKAVAGSTVKPVLKRVPGLGGHFGRERKLPDTELVVSDIEIERDHLTAYDRVCGFRLRDELPPTYPHMLGFPMQMQIMTASDFPFPVIGLVHLRNRIEQLRLVRVDEPLSMRVWTGDLEPHEKGTQFLIHAVASVGDEEVWRSQSTYLRKGEKAEGQKAEEKADGQKADGQPDLDEPPEPKAIWQIPDDIGRRYAGVSGDSNPIHLRRSTALAFGMPRPIAHGMWTKARCLAALEGTLPDSLVVDVRFKLPLFLPSKVAFTSWEEDGGRAFTLNAAKDGKPHLAGTVQPL
jgi:acyl dehydratase